MDKKTRKPLDIIADKQSYDVWEQLRCRDLSDDYLPLVARCFARKVIANILPTMYSESGLIFISYRRISIHIQKIIIKRTLNLMRLKKSVP